MYSDKNTKQQESHTLHPCSVMSLPNREPERKSLFLFTDLSFFPDTLFLLFFSYMIQQEGHDGPGSLT